MKKLIINICDSTYEKLLLESMIEHKSVHQTISDRIFYKPFDKEIEKAYDENIQKQLIELTKE